MDDTLACPSCAAPAMGPYCAQCGEKRRSAHDFSFRHIFSEVIETLTHFDSKILRTT